MTEEIEWQSEFDGREWAVVDHEFLSRGADGVRRRHRTYGRPTSVRRYFEAWRTELDIAADTTGVPLAILLATVCTENGAARDGSFKGLAIRHPMYRQESRGRMSVGPCHVLISTAKDVIGDVADKEWLSDLGNNLLAAAKYIESGRAVTGWDPILVAARYNSGGISDSSSPESVFHNHWHLRSYGDHLDRFADWYGDALAVLAAGEERDEVYVPEPTFETPSLPPIRLRRIDRTRIELLQLRARRKGIEPEQFASTLDLLAEWVDEYLRDVPWYRRARTTLAAIRDLFKILSRS